MKTEICKCNNCNSIMYDENPKVGATKIDETTIDSEILPMELLNEDGDSFWGCGNCQTDAYLTDYQSNLEIFDLITYDMVKNISHGEELKVNDEYVLYHYTEDDLIVLVKEDKWEEVATILYNDLTQSVEFEIY